MKLKDLLFETRIFQNNFVKVEMIQDELIVLFPENTPEVKFDDKGMYIAIDNFQYRELETKGGFKKFFLTDSGLVNEIKNITKYYIEFAAIKTQNKIPTTLPTEETTSEAI